MFPKEDLGSVLKIQPRENSHHMSRSIPRNDGRPPTPRSNPEEYANLIQAMRRNVASPYKQDSGRIPAPHLIGSEHSTTYSSPASNHWTQDDYGAEPQATPYGYAYPNPEEIGKVSSSEYPLCSYI